VKKNIEIVSCEKHKKGNQKELEILFEIYFFKIINSNLKIKLIKLKN
jgi:hypothetical protein